MKRISDRAMANYWTKRVAELEAMRPITAAEAIAAAQKCEAIAAKLTGNVVAAEHTPRESGRVAIGDSVQARDARNARALGVARRAVWGDATRALVLRGRASALRLIAKQPVGVALAESLAEARARRDYYCALCVAGSVSRPVSGN